MARPKKSLFDWLTGDSGPEAGYTFDDLESGTTSPVRPAVSRANTQTTHINPRAAHPHAAPEPDTLAYHEPEPEGELAVDVYTSPTHIIIRAMIAGVRPEDLDVSITRDEVTIRGKRERHTEAGNAEFFFQELYWGAFVRSITLPHEVEIEGAEASERHGLLTIRLPRIDKGRQAKLKVKSS